MSGDHARASTALTAKVRQVEALLEQRGLIDPAELDRARSWAAGRPSTRMPRSTCPACRPGRA